MNYRIADTVPSPELSEYSLLLRTLLSNRGITTQKEAEEFLNPDYKRDIKNPFGILNMEKSVERILAAMVKDERIAVYADYDCDGIPAGTILHDFFTRVGYKNFRVYIPDRHLEGYGLNKIAIETLAKDGVTLMITVDCGISDVEPVANAQSLGIDVIVSDHHLPQEKLPEAFAVVNSKQAGDTYHDNMLSGAGVAWKMVQGLFIRGGEKGMFAEVPKDWEKWLLDMAGLAAVADLVPLQKENRAIAHFGLKVLRKSPRPGLQKLLSLARVSQSDLTEDDIAFMIAPRLNAASRMGTPRDAFELLSSTDVSHAGALAEHLQGKNDERKLLVARMVKEAKSSLEKRELRDVIVVGNPNWRIGVLGIAATHLVEEYCRPVFVWGREGGAMIKGSCRSDGTVNLVELMATTTTGTFLGLGGHEQAGGFSVAEDRVHLMEEELVRAYEKVRKEGIMTPEVVVDAKLTPDEVTNVLWRDLARLAPFGMGNPKPTFLFENVSIAGVKMFGKDKNHLELSIARQSGVPLKAISFFAEKPQWRAIASGDIRTITATIEESTFGRRPEIRLRIVDISA